MVGYLAGALICLTITHHTFFIKINPGKSRELFGYLALFFGVICMLDFTSQVSTGSELPIYVQKIALIIYPFAPFLIMLIPMNLYKPLQGSDMVKIMALPAIIGFFSFICGCITGAEQVTFQGIHFVKLIYNTEFYSTWLLLNFIPVIVMYYFFYKILKSPEARENNDFMKSANLLVFALTLIVVACYAFAIAEAVLGTPPLSSIGNAIGISLAMAAFKLRGEQM